MDEHDEPTKRGLFLEWDQDVFEAIKCLVLIANGGEWRRWEQHSTDTRGIVTDRAGMAITKHINALQRAVNAATEAAADGGGRA
jgi:hypothetical protein